MEGSHVTITLFIPDKATADLIERALAAAGLCLHECGRGDKFEVIPIPDYLCKADRDIADRLVNLKGYAP
jgi:hypothetical protein